MGDLDVDPMLKVFALPCPCPRRLVIGEGALGFKVHLMARFSLQLRGIES